LREVLSQCLRILAVSGRLERLVQREGHITGDSEMIERNINQSLLSLARGHARFDLPQTFTDEQCAVDEHAVCRSVDLKVPEKHIGAEKRQDFVYAVVRLAVGRHIHIGDIGGQRGEGVCGAASTGAEGEDREIA
jgi:hypothetical protein